MGKWLISNTPSNLDTILISVISAIVVVVISFIFKNIVVRLLRYFKKEIYNFYKYLKEKRIYRNQLKLIIKGEGMFLFSTINKLTKKEHKNRLEQKAFDAYNEEKKKLPLGNIDIDVLKKAVAKSQAEQFARFNQNPENFLK